MFFDVASDIAGTITLSNGHNIFGSDVLGNVAGDRENIAASAVFANHRSGHRRRAGQRRRHRAPPANATNPALGAADRFAIGSTDQIGTARPTPSGTNPDAGAAESGFAHSTVSSANNDTLTGTAAANTLNGLAGHDFLKGLGGADTLNGGDGGDFLEGGTGNDRLNGGTGIDIANYGDSSTKVVVDLRGDAATTRTPPSAAPRPTRSPGSRGPSPAAVPTGSGATAAPTGSRAAAARTPSPAAAGATSTTTT